MSESEMTIEQARAKLRAWIPPMVRVVFEYYKSYLESHKPMVNSTLYFKQFSQAGISGISHLEKLLRLYRQVADAQEMTPDLAREIAILEQQYALGNEREDTHE